MHVRRGARARGDPRRLGGAADDDVVATEREVLGDGRAALPRRTASRRARGTGIRLAAAPTARAPLSEAGIRHAAGETDAVQVVRANVVAPSAAAEAAERAATFVGAAG